MDEHEPELGRHTKEHGDDYEVNIMEKCSHTVKQHNPTHVKI